MAGKTLAAQRGEEGEEEITIIVPGDDAATHSKSAAAAGATTKRVALEYEFNQMEKDLIRRAQELMLGGAAVGALCFTFVGRSLYDLSRRARGLERAPVPQRVGAGVTGFLAGMLLGVLPGLTFLIRDLSQLESPLGQGEREVVRSTNLRALLGRGDQLPPLPSSSAASSSSSNNNNNNNTPTTTTEQRT